MRKSLGSKRNVMDEKDIATITRSFGDFETVTKELDKPAAQKSNRGRQSANPKIEAPKTFSSKIFDTHEFGYRRITIERPLRESYQFSDERIAGLRFAPKPLNAVMKWAYAEYGANWSDNDDCENYGRLTEHEEAIRKHIKSHFSGLKEKQIKDFFNPLTWIENLYLFLKVKKLQSIIGIQQHDDMNVFDDKVMEACRKLLVSVDSKERKKITAVISWKNPEAKRVIKKIHKVNANPIYGLFKVNGKVIEYKADDDLRDNENVALDPSKSVNRINEAYFKKEVQPHVPDA